MNPTDFEATLFMRACRRKPTVRTPIWLMRQAGRYMPEYRKLRAQIPFLELCKNPERAAEITVFAAERLGVDAAILFADLLLIVEPLGFSLEYSAGDGPQLGNPICEPRDVDRVRDFVPGALGYVMDTVRRVRGALSQEIPLIGFAGAPFTVGAYLIEGQTSRAFTKTRAFMHCHPEAWTVLMEKLVVATARYLNEQIDAGVQAVQIFDSWVGCLGPSDYRQVVAPHTKALISMLRPGVPVIHFGTGTAALLELMQQAGGDVIGVDWRVDLGAAWRQLGDVAIMGNLDPAVLLTNRDTVRAQVARILAEAGGQPGHIFNLGHGVLPETPVENVMAIVEEVRIQSERQRRV